MTDKNGNIYFLESAIDCLKSKEMTLVHGPLGFTNLDSQGLLIESISRNSINLNNIIMKNALKTILLFCLIGMITFSCKKDDEDNNTSGSNQTDMSLGAFVCDKDGNAFEMIVTQSNDLIAGSSTSGSLKKLYFSSVRNQSTEFFAGISMGSLSNPNAAHPDDTDFINFISLGDKVYAYETGVGTNSGTSDGAGVWMYIDGVEWSTSKGVADQTGSTFEITEVTVQPFTGDQYIKVEATFSCKIYDDNGNSMVLTNGTFVGSFGNF